MPFFLGIDSGGTKTQCVLGDEHTIIARAMSGGSNIVRLGEPRARESLHSAIDHVCSAAKIASSQIYALCIGAAGAARPEIAAKVRRILADILAESSTRIEVVGDSDIALEAAFGAKPGLIVIAGTGSIAYGRSATGQIARAGGWGFAVSDEGSGHWIGREAISAVLNARDQQIETMLSSAILQTWKLTSIEEMVQQANSTPPPDFPRLTPVVLGAADQGDHMALHVLSEAAVKLARLAEIVLHRLAVKGHGLGVATTGSVFRQSLVVRKIFQDTLQAQFPGIGIQHDAADPVEGALAMARRL